MTLLSDPRLLDAGVPAPCSAPEAAAPVHPEVFVLAADERQLDTAARILNLALAVRTYRRGGARVICVIREHHHAAFGRGRLWVGRPRRGDRESVGRLTPALVAEAVRLLRIACTTLKPATDGQLDQDLPRIQSLLSEGIVVIATSSGAGPVHLASGLDAKLLSFDPGPPGTWERPTRTSVARSE